MLNFFRRRDTVVRVMLGGFLVVICVAMVMFLIPQGAGSDTGLPPGQQTVASVNGTPILGNQLTTQLTRYENGQQIPPQLVPMLGQEILRQLVIQQALVDQARSLGLTPTNAEIVQAAQQQISDPAPTRSHARARDSASARHSAGLGGSSPQSRPYSHERRNRAGRPAAVPRALPWRQVRGRRPSGATAFAAPNDAAAIRRSDAAAAHDQQDRKSGHRSGAREPGRSSPAVREGQRKSSP